jgi:hypothetical protein
MPDSTVSSEETKARLRLRINTTTSQIPVTEKETEEHTSVYPQTPILRQFPRV